MSLNQEERRTRIKLNQPFAKAVEGLRRDALSRDRDCCYGGSFNAKAASLGIDAILTPLQAPKANAAAGR